MLQETWRNNARIWKTSFSRLHFWFILISFQFFPKFELPNSGCSLSANAVPLQSACIFFFTSFNFQSYFSTSKEQRHSGSCSGVKRTGHSILHIWVNSLNSHDRLSQVKKQNEVEIKKVNFLSCKLFSWSYFSFSPKGIAYLKNKTENYTHYSLEFCGNALKLDRVNNPIKREHWSSVGICDWQAEHLCFVI